MRQLRFYGSSDDLFEARASDGWAEEQGGFETTMAYFVASPRDGGRMFVTAEYAPKATNGACWAIGVSQVDEDVPLPDWPMRFETHESGYSVVLVIDAPDDTQVLVQERP